MIVLALGWITLWFSGERNGQTEGIDKGSAAAQSLDDTEAATLSAS